MTAEVGSWTNHPRASPTRGCDAAAWAKTAPAKKRAPNVNRSPAGPRKRRSPPAPTKPVPPTSPGRSSSRCGPPTPRLQRGRLGSGTGAPAGRRIRTPGAAVHHPADALRRRRRRPQLTVDRGNWENEPLTYEEKWFRCKGRNPEGTGGTCKVIARKNSSTGKSEPATGTTYVAGAGNVGLWIEDQETAENTGGWNVAVSQAVQIASPSPRPTRRPRGHGDRTEGPDAVGEAGDVEQRAPDAALAVAALQQIRRQLQRNQIRHRRQLHGRSEDVRHALKVSETVENGAGRSKPSTSAATQAVPTPASSAVADHGSEDHRHADPGPGRDAPCRAAGATSRSPSPTSGCAANTRVRAVSRSPAPAPRLLHAHRGQDVGHTIVLVETATNAAGSTAGDSKPSAAVAGAVPVSSVPPTINGNVQQGQPLSAVHGSWSNEPSGLQLPVATVQRNGGAQMQSDRGRPRTHLHAHGARRRRDAVGEQNSLQRDRLREGRDLRHDRRSGARGAPEPDAPRRSSGRRVWDRRSRWQAGQWSNGTKELLLQWVRCEAGECHPIEGATQHTYKLGRRPTPACRSPSGKRPSTPAARMPPSRKRWRSNPPPPTCSDSGAKAPEG